MDNVPTAYADIDWEGLTHARRALIGNPYITPAEDLDVATAWFFKHQDILARAMLGLCEMNRRADARKLLIAGLHSFSRAGLALRLKSLLDGVGVLKTNGVEIETADLNRLAAGLSRFYAATKKFLGTSRAVVRIHEEAWTLCFGANLYESLAQETALRRLNVLILGETGTGKERVAAMIQGASFAVLDGPKITINCAALPRELAESELFGAEKGAHSTAMERRVGKIAAAHQGTLFLDEVADLSPEVQSKLLSTMSNGELTPIGSNRVTTVDVRYIAATSRPLLDMVRDGTFREDLYQRIAGRTVMIPPLRDRPQDIIEIGRRLFKDLRGAAEPAGALVDLSSDIGAVAPGGTPDLDWLDGLKREPWPGNVRELEAAVRQRVLGLAPQPGIRLRGPSGEHLDVPERILEGQATERDVINWYMRLVLEKTNGNLSETQRILDVDRSTIRRRLDHAQGSTKR